MLWIPFICIGIGLLLGIRNLPEKVLKTADRIVNGALVLLMLVIGLSIGVNDSVMESLPLIGRNCVVVALSAMFFSVLLVVLLEKTLIPLDTFKEKFTVGQKPPVTGDLPDEDGGRQDEDKKTSPLLYIMPVSIVAGVAIGYYLLPSGLEGLLDNLLMVALVFLYTGVGVTMGTNKHVFGYIRLLGAKVLLFPVAILAGSVIGGIAAGFLVSMPLSISVSAAGGMSYYSITGAYLTQIGGIEAGTYGFVVNVMREFLTVLLMPLLVRISKGSPLATGGAGNMDTMLVPITKVVGPEIGLVALVTGVMLTFAVPFLLPVLYGMFTLI